MQRAFEEYYVRKWVDISIAFKFNGPMAAKKRKAAKKSTKKVAKKKAAKKSTKKAAKRKTAKKRK